MNDLVEFLHARLDEAAKRAALDDPARALREVTAKRLLMDEIFRYECKIDSEWGCCHSAESIAAGRCEEISPDEIGALRILAAIDSDHPDYRQEWAL